MTERASSYRPGKREQIDVVFSCDTSGSTPSILFCSAQCWPNGCCGRWGFAGRRGRDRGSVEFQGVASSGLVQNPRAKPG